MLIIISIGVINPFWGRLFVLFCGPVMGVMMAHKNNGGAEMTAAAFVSHTARELWCRGRGGVFVLFGVVGAFFVAPCVVVCDLFLCFGESWDIV